MNPRRNQAGVGLIEVLIAVLVLGVGLLGIAALQAITLRNSSTSAERTQAAMQTYSMLDTLRSQRTAAIAGTFNTGTEYKCSTSSALGAAGSLDGWLADLRNTVSSSACGRVNCAPNSKGITTCIIAVRWSELRATGGSDEQPPIVTESRL